MYILLGAMQYLQVFASANISFEFLGKYTIYPVSIIIFSAVLFAVLLIYIKVGVGSARTLILGIIISNFLLTVIAGITYFQENILGMISENATRSIFIIDYKYFMIGTIILLVDFILLVILYQFLISKARKIYHFLILFISLALVLVFDSLVFNLILKYGNPEFTSSLVGHIVGKISAAFGFSLMLYIYIKYIDKDKTNVSFIANQDRDIFSILRYRKKYLSLKIEKKQVEKKLVSQLESTLNNISDGFVSLDTNWCYTYVNIKAGEFLGKSPEYLIGKHIWTEFPEGIDHPFYKAYYKAVETQQTQVVQEYFQPFQKWFENRVYPTSDGLTIYFTDITELKKAELHLKESENHIRTILETEPECIKQLNAKGELIYMNPAGLAMIEADSLEMVKGKSVIDLINRNDQRAFKKLTTAVFNGNSGQLVFELKGIKGTMRWLETHAVPLKDTEGNITSLLGVTRDITDRKKAEELIIKNEKYLNNIINHIGDPVFVKNEKSQFLLVNNSCCAFFNLSRAEIIGKTLAEDIPKDEMEIFFKIDKQVIDTGIEKINEESLTVRDGKTRVISTKKTRFIDNNGNKFLIGTIRDITDRKKAEVEITNYKNHLEELVEVRTNELEKETTKAQSADLMKSAFLATMSHELRTPMNSIIGFTGILLKEFAGPVNAEQKKQLLMVKNSGQHLLGLINDILDISKIEAGKLKVYKYPFNYVSVLEKTIEFLSPQAIKKGLQISSEFSEAKIILNSDERRIEQIVLNLISNAIKFSNQGTILVKVAIHNNLLTTQIIDQGIGISKEDLNKLFIPFIQLNGGLARSHEGSGLGLSICKNLIEKLGGTIQVKSKIGEGSNFTFNLPIEQDDSK
jgi:PAS domain S-box-containing protein